MNMNPAVLIAGAGPTGLMLALWLARQDVRLRIVDKTEGPGTTSRALVMHARTLEFFQQLGISDTAIANGRKFLGVKLWAHARLAGAVALGNIGEGLSPFPFMLILPQDVQERLLIEELAKAGVEVERRTELIAFQDHGDGVEARLRLGDGREETLSCEWLAGCDGAHSIVRHASGLDFPGAVYEHMFYVADVEAHGPVINEAINLALDSSDFLAAFPLPGEHKARLIGTIKAGLADADERELRWEDVSSTILEQLKVEIERVNWFSTYRVHHRVANHFRLGRAFVLGDAAHIHSPVGGQGMNTGLGDAVNLAWKLALVVKGRADAKLLDTYEPERIAFAKRLVASTDRAFTFVTSPGPIARLVREDIVPYVLPRIMRLDAARRLMFRTISQIEIKYRESALSAGRAGQVRGGDRLPWIGENYLPLRSMQWQAHVYGAPRETIVKTCAELRLGLHVFPWSLAARGAGLFRDGAYLVRPDGYVGLAQAQPDGAQLRDYFTRIGVRA
jgi:2-polyprenyl-6-methoxyphenol hydroxylase-like FAD-dependent oxidoreductase